MMSLSGSSGRTIGRPPFTPTQWEELEHQALIYKYMVSGVPVPPELIFSIRRSLDTSLVSRLLPHQSLGWGCYQMGFGRKPDPEPGRCRRTDGKKWRCSREAYPDSKYCEKHMHRGRNRARKSLDQNQTTTTSLTSPSLSFPNNNNPSPTLSSSSSSSTTYSASSSSMDAYSNSNRFGVGGSSSNTRGYFNSHSLDYPYPSTSPKQQQQQPLHHASALSLHQNTNSTSQFNVLASPTDHKDFRYFQGIGERVGVGERTFFPEASRSFQDSPYHHHQQPLTTVMNDPYHHCSTDHKIDHHHHTYSSSSSSQQHLHHDQEHDHRQQQQQCFVLGADMFNKPTRSVLANSSRQDQNQEEEEKDSSESSKKSLHHFFGEDWAQNKNSSDSWLDLSSHSRLDTGS
ncbi:Glutamine-Leucine-Glutamine QLQ [Arabidopsis thaliana x Arabidopsis arenosa]|uniref:Growth-regulating factor n=1 Tax=Arabidopsis thaliana x Arabidopsis arenosa TaxID=1240361 RepID=A0A8T2AZ63_9BRAS|nr:Glutamine-Leucine-Glutamine QLQ [Arabidopsis thaliana x Arabidopsis arenosa]